MVNYDQMLTGYDDILLPEDIMKILKYGRNKIYHYLATGQIRSIQMGKRGYRIPKIYLIEFLQQNDTPTKDR